MEAGGRELGLGEFKTDLPLLQGAAGKVTTEQLAEIWQVAVLFERGLAEVNQTGRLGVADKADLDPPFETFAVGWGSGSRGVAAGPGGITTARTARSAGRIGGPSGLGRGDKERGDEEEMA